MPPPETDVNRNQLVSRYLELQQQLVEAYTACPGERESIQRLTEELAATLRDVRHLPTDSGQGHDTAMRGVIVE